ncbi:MAG: hypothetical protein AAFT19_04210 [Pseudomonadota bacterium]
MDDLPHPDAGYEVLDRLDLLLDARLALTPLGLVLALRLSRRHRLWLARSFWAMLDNDEFFQRHPAMIGGSSDGAVEAACLATWRRAWMRADLLKRCYWVGDAKYDCRLPPLSNAEPTRDFDWLSMALDRRLDTRYDAVAPLDDCARDVLALSAMLLDRPTVILTAPGPDGGPPALCDLLQRAGIVPRKATGPEGDRLGARFLAAMHGLDLAQLQALGTELVLIHLVVPGAAAPEMPDPGDFDLWDDDAMGDSDPWAEAAVLWHPVACGSHHG